MLFNLLLHNNKRIKNLIKYRFIVLFFLLFQRVLGWLNFCSCNVKNYFLFFFFNKIYLTQELIHLIENQFFNKERIHILFDICLDKSYSIKTSVLINMYAFISKIILIANSLISNTRRNKIRNKKRIKLCFLFILRSYRLITRFFLYIKIFKMHSTYVPLLQIVTI